MPVSSLLLTAEQVTSRRPVSTEFDEIGQAYLTEGPWTDGPMSFFESRDVFITTVAAPPSTTPFRTLMGVGT